MKQGKPRKAVGVGDAAMITNKRVDICLRTIASICASPLLDQYLIGFTSIPANKKGDQYRSIDFEHLILIADKLSCSDALKLENLIQGYIFNNPDTILYRKYHAEKIAFGRRIRSMGGVVHDPTTKECSVYMAWWDRDISN